MWLPFPVDQPDACHDQGIICPMTAGKTYTFKTVLPIKSLYPDVSSHRLTIRFAMVATKQIAILIERWSH